MPNYQEIIYFTEEYGEDKYPQKLCNYIHDKYFKEYLEKRKLKYPRLLDIGSGKGNHLMGFSRLGFKVYGLDKRKEFAKILKDFDIRECDIEKDRFPFRSNFFDFVFPKSVIEHVRNVDNFVEQTFRVLKPGGIAILLTPDWISQMRYFYDDYTHASPFSRKGLQNILRLYDFSEVECKLFYQLPFVWKHSYLGFIPKIIALLPDSLKWKDKEEHNPRKLIKFSQEKMLFAKAVKPN